VDSGTGCGPHGADTSKMKSWTIEPVHGGGRVKWFGGRPNRARGVWWFAHKTIGGQFLGLGFKTKSEGPTRQRRDPGVSGSFEAEDTRLSVRNVVPTLTSNKRRGLSLNGRC
jgi:hypothetical protein